MDLGELVGVFMGILFFAGATAAVGSVVYLIMKLRAGEKFNISLRALLGAYLYLGAVIGLLVTVHGSALLLNAMFSLPFGKAFSYEAQPIFDAVPTEDGKTPSGISKRPSPDELREQRARHLDRGFRTGVLNGIMNVFFGGLFWGVHVVTRMRLEKAKGPDRGILRKAYLVILLAIFGIGSIITLPTGTFEAVSYYVIEPIEEFGMRDPPGPRLATSIVFTPIWIFYLLAAIREVRQSE